MQTSVYLGLGALLLGCKKETEEDKLPPATQIGANTGGYLLDGQAIVANGIPGSNGLLSSTQPTPALTGELLNDTTVCVTLHTLRGGQRYSLTFFVRHRGPGTYYFNRTTSSYSGIDLPSLRSYGALYLSGGGYRTDSLHTGSITISSLNRASGLVAGRFEFIARGGGQSTVQVTQGRFDFKR